MGISVSGSGSDALLGGTGASRFKGGIGASNVESGVFGGRIGASGTLFGGKIGASDTVLVGGIGASDVFFGRGNGASGAVFAQGIGASDINFGGVTGASDVVLGGGIGTFFGDAPRVDVLGGGTGAVVFDDGFDGSVGVSNLSESFGDIVGKAKIFGGDMGDSTLEATVGDPECGGERGPFHPAWACVSVLSVGGDVFK